MKGFATNIQVVELEQWLSLLSVLGEPLYVEKIPVHSW